MTSLRLICDWLDSHHSSCVEVIGFLTGIVNVWLVTRQSILSWPVGLINAAMYMVVFGRAGLYSDTGLQAVYFVLSLYGWWHWWQGGPQHGELPVSRTSSATALVLAPVAVVIWLSLWQLTARIPGAAIPHLDAALVSASLIAQWMMTRKLLEHWLVWIAVNAVYVGLFFNRHLPLTAVLYSVFLFLAILGYRKWRRTDGKLAPESAT